MRKIFSVVVLFAILISAFSFRPKKKHHLPKVLRDLKVVNYIPEQEGEGGFYLFRCEVSNFDYAEFLWHLENENRLEELSEARLDSLNWLYAQVDRPQEWVSGYAKKHDYPVVNVRKKGAELYCQWLSDHWNKAQDEFTLTFRLPTKAEWQYAARGGNAQSPYAWGGPYPQNIKGCYLGNFLEFEREGDLTVPVETFSPNDFGLYNMNGNVAEWLSEGQMGIGGAWNTAADVSTIEHTLECKKSAFNLGFRPLLTIEPRTEK
jgi:formylglycine-generating enzyme required for sulfatase activity